MKRGAPKADPEKVRAFIDRGRRSSAESLRSKPMTKREHMATPMKPKRSGFTPASKEQRAKVDEDWCVVCAQMGGCDPAHLAARAIGGCDHELCVVPLCRLHHRAFDDGGLDLLPYLIDRCYLPELQHALGHYNGDLIALLQRLTGTRWGPLEGGEGL